MKELIRERIKEKPTNAKNSWKLRAGMSIHLLETPAKIKAIILKSLIIKVTIYKTTADETHLKRPKVTRLRGSSRRLIMGCARRNVPVSAAPATSKVNIPFSNIIPEATFDMAHREKVSIT